MMSYLKIDDVDSHFTTFKEEETWSSFFYSLLHLYKLIIPRIESSNKRRRQGEEGVRRSSRLAPRRRVVRSRLLFVDVLTVYSLYPPTTAHTHDQTTCYGQQQRPFPFTKAKLSCLLQTDTKRRKRFSHRIVWFRTASSGRVILLDVQRTVLYE